MKWLKYHHVWREGCGPEEWRPLTYKDDYSEEALKASAEDLIRDIEEIEGLTYNEGYRGTNFWIRPTAPRGVLRRHLGVVNEKIASLEKQREYLLRELKEEK